MASVGLEHPDRLAAGQRRRRRGVPVQSTAQPTARCSRPSFSPTAAAATSAPRWRAAQNTALIGAPAPIWAPRDAGAVYLFDADPESPTFGQPSPPSKSRRPSRATSSATAVGFDNGGPGRRRGRRRARRRRCREPSISIRWAITCRALVSVSSATTYATGGAYDSVIVSGTFSDADPFATLTGSINWGDGSATDRLTLAGGCLCLFGPARTTRPPRTAVSLHDRRDA